MDSSDLKVTSFRIMKQVMLVYDKKANLLVGYDLREKEMKGNFFGDVAFKLELLKEGACNNKMNSQLFKKDFS